jgi:hypothetical protein
MKILLSENQNFDYNPPLPLSSAAMSQSNRPRTRLAIPLRGSLQAFFPLEVVEKARNGKI